MKRRLPSLHLPILALAGFLSGLGAYYLLVWAASAVLYVPIAVGLLSVWEISRRVSGFARKRLSDEEDAEWIPPDEDRIHTRRAALSLRRSRPDMAVFGVFAIIGLGLAYHIWGPLPAFNAPRSYYGVVQ